jgi:predicted nucleic acid-binding protein
MNLLLDTSVIIDTLRLRHGRKELLRQLVNDGHRLMTTAINVAEVYAGMRSGEEQRTVLLLSSLECYGIDAAVGEHAGRLKNSWSKKGRTLALPDALVAAIAIGQGCALLTDNQKDFPMSELKLFPLP